MATKEVPISEFGLSINTTVPSKSLKNVTYTVIPFHCAAYAAEWEKGNRWLIFKTIRRSITSQKTEHVGFYPTREDAETARELINV